MPKRTVRESERRRRKMADLLVLPRPAKSLQNAPSFSWINLSIQCLLKRKEWSQCHRESSWQGRQSHFAKRKRNRAVCSQHQIVRCERVKMSESRTLTREREIRARAWREEGGLHSEKRQVSRRERKGCKENLNRSKRKHKRVSWRKSTPGGSRESLFHSPSLARPKMGKEVGRRRVRS